MKVVSICHVISAQFKSQLQQGLGRALGLVMSEMLILEGSIRDNQRSVLEKHLQPYQCFSSLPGQGLILSI